MKKNLPYIILFFLLIIIVTYLYLSQRSGTITDAEFRILNTKEIAGIDLSDKNGHKMSLLKKEGLWYVNGTFPADKNKIINILETINKFQIEAPVSNRLRDVAINDLRKYSIKVSMKDAANEEIKTIHIGNTAPGGIGNYMILEDHGTVSADPYVVKFPGIEGNLIYRFTPDTMQWKSTAVFNTDIDKIASISVSYFENPKYNFTLEKDEEIIKINPIHDSLKINKTLNKSNVVNFLLEFEKMHFEGWLPQEDTFLTKVKSSPKYATIKLVDVFGKESKILLYRKPPAENAIHKDARGKEIAFDLEKYWAYIPKTNSYVLAQYYVFGPVLRDYSYFFEDKK